MSLVSRAISASPRPELKFYKICRRAYRHSGNVSQTVTNSTDVTVCALARPVNCSPNAQDRKTMRVPRAKPPVLPAARILVSLLFSIFSIRPSVCAGPGCRRPGNQPGCTRLADGFRALSRGRPERVEGQEAHLSSLEDALPVRQPFHQQHPATTVYINPTTQPDQQRRSRSLPALSRWQHTHTHTHPVFPSEPTTNHYVSGGYSCPQCG